MIQLRKFGLNWEMQNGFESILSKLWDRPTEVIKESASKSVLRCQFGDENYFIKKYHVDAVPGRSLKYLFKPSPVKGEWRLASKLDELQVPCVRHEAFGERWSVSGLQESVLITRGFPGVPLHLSQYWVPESLREFLDNLHSKGVLQRDLHPSNILFDRESSRFSLVDVYGIEIRDSLSQEDKQKNLAYLRMFVGFPVDKSTIELSRQISKAVFAKRSRRCLKENREFTCQRINGISWNFRKPFMDEAAHEILSNPNHVLDQQAKILKPGRSTTVGAWNGYVIKRYHIRRSSRILKNLFRWSPGKRSYKKAYHLELRGIPTAAAVACGEHRIGRFLVRSFFIMQQIPKAHYLTPESGGLNQKAIELAEVIGRLHNEGFVHRDLKLNNLLFDDIGKLHIIDLDGLEFVEDVSCSQAAANLSRLDRDVRNLMQVSYGHRFRFLRRYFKVRGIRPGTMR